MTIGVAATGTNAGAAVRAAVEGAELLGRGAIGGFAVFAVVDDKGRLARCSTQRGGVQQLSMPSSWLRARHAAVISSGPDRPEPLAQFLTGADRIGMVTGHRLPNRPSADGKPVNEAVMTLMSTGQSPQRAIDTVLGANPEIDAGLIAMDLKGGLGIGNSSRVNRRTDSGAYQRDDGKAQLAILHNSIAFLNSCTQDVAELAWGILTEQAMPTRFLRLHAAVPLQAAKQDRTHIRADGTIVAIDTANPYLRSATGSCTVIYMNSEVWLDGCRIGHVVSELVAEVSGGQVTALGSIAPVVVMKEDKYVSP